MIGNGIEILIAWINHDLVVGLLIQATEYKTIFPTKGHRVVERFSIDLLDPMKTT